MDMGRAPGGQKVVIGHKNTAASHIRCVTIREFQSENARNPNFYKEIDSAGTSIEFSRNTCTSKSRPAHKEIGGLYTATEDGCGDSSFGYQMKEAHMGIGLFLERIQTRSKTSWKQGLGFLKEVEAGRKRRNGEEQT